MLRRLLRRLYLRPYRSRIAPMGPGSLFERCMAVWIADTSAVSR